MTSTRTRQRVSSDGTREQRPFVLVVHRSAALRNALLSTLDFDGFDVMTMADEDEAALIVRYIPPHAVVVDRRLVSSDRGDVVAEANRARIPVIAFDDGALMPSTERCRDLGVHPVRWDDGVARLLEVLHELAVPPAPVLSRLA